MATMMAKLQMKPGQRLVLVRPPEDMQAFLTGQMSGVQVVTEVAARPEGVLAFVRNQAELAELAPLVFQTVAPGGLAWIAFPKGGSGAPGDLNRDRLWEALKSSGWRPVRNVVIDEVWSALRFRPAELVGK